MYELTERGFLIAMPFIGGSKVEQGEPWLVLADVCKVLDIANPRNVTARLDDDEKNTVHLADGIRGNPNVTIINESGLYSVVLRSDKPDPKFGV